MLVNCGCGNVVQVAVAAACVLALFLPGGACADPVRTLTVNSLLDDGSGTCTVAYCTLRDAIAAAEDGDTVDFSVTGTIVLTHNATLNVTHDITLHGPGAANLTVDFNNATNTYFNFTNAGVADVSGLTFTGATNNAALYNGAVGATYNISDCRFTGNRGTNEPVYAQHGTWNLANDVFTGNSTTDYAGAIYAGDPDGNITITGSTFSSNSITGGYAGAIYFYGAHLTIADSTFSGNDVGGGFASAIYVDGGGSGTEAISNTTFNGNLNGSLGAVYDYRDRLTLINVTLAGNSSGTGRGSAGVATDGGGTTHIVNSTVYDNTDAGSPTLDRVTGTLDVVNSIVYNGTCSAGVASLGNNLATDASCPFTQHAASGIFAAGLANNGGSVDTVALAAGSPALDAANEASAPATDARGTARPQGPRSDLGAYELVASGGGGGSSPSGSDESSGGSTSSGTSADTTAPSVPGTSPAGPPGVRLVVTPGGIVQATLALAWTSATDDVGVDHYVLLMDGVVVLTIPGSATSLSVPTFSAAGTRGGARVTFQLAAVDAAGNRGRALTVILVSQPRPAGLLKAIPKWAWPLLRWQHLHTGSRPASAPSKLPMWYATWAAWRLHPVRIQTAS